MEGTQRWARRALPDDLAREYVAQGWWTDATLGSMVADGLAGLGPTQFHVWSKVHPFTGTIGELYDTAGRLAASLHRLGVRAGDVVAYQVPNWAESVSVKMTPFLARSSLSEP